MYTIHGTAGVNIHTYVNTTATVTTTLVQDVVDFTHTVALGAVKAVVFIGVSSH